MNIKVGDFVKCVFVPSSKDVAVMTCCHILSVMGDIAAHLNDDTKERIVSKLCSVGGSIHKKSQC